MATLTLGTAANNTLTAVAYSLDPGVLLPADLATINVGILDPVGNRHYPAAYSGLGGFVREGVLIVPARGTLKVLEGDYIAIDPATGWPILLSPQAAAGASWVHS